MFQKGTKAVLDIHYNHYFQINLRKFPLKKTATQVFASEIYEISSDTYLQEYLRATASDKT